MMQPDLPIPFLPALPPAYALHTLSPEDAMESDYELLSDALLSLRGEAAALSAFAAQAADPEIAATLRAARDAVTRARETVAQQRGRMGQ